ncbi:YunG family protein [Sinorhizobium saheli]|uniref:YunG family protein n=1 Tax=Sinorhizobium saheli TaxID=36856 RepID=UPI0009FE338C|nr:hypothetical protein [Sinorhizobium saheli]
MADSTSPDRKGVGFYRSIAALQEALMQAWSPASSGKYAAENPARGQCGVTALVVQDVFCRPRP